MIFLIILVESEVALAYICSTFREEPSFTYSASASKMASTRFSLLTGNSKVMILFLMWMVVNV